MSCGDASAGGCTIAGSNQLESWIQQPGSLYPVKTKRYHTLQTIGFSGSLDKQASRRLPLGHRASSTRRGFNIGASLHDIVSVREIGKLGGKSLSYWQLFWALMADKSPRSIPVVPFAASDDGSYRWTS
ncbi:hypothetical protein CBL_01716 [Carabus blaptoides fortunei]